MVIRSSVTNNKLWWLANQGTQQTPFFEEIKMNKQKILLEFVNLLQRGTIFKEILKIPIACYKLFSRGIMECIGF